MSKMKQVWPVFGCARSKIFRRGIDASVILGVEYLEHVAKVVATHEKQKTDCKITRHDMHSLHIPADTQGRLQLRAC
jgi:hypothetical protein